MRKLLRQLLPSGIVEFYKFHKKRSREKLRDQLQESKQIITQEIIETELNKAGLMPGDVVMLHSSLSKLGFVENGANTVIDALVNIVGNEGTVMMPSFPAIGFNYDYLISNPVFDVNVTPSKTGIITETFRKREGVKRSLHPTEPVCAFGKQAEFLVKDHFGQLYPYNQNSPFGRLCELKGKIVLMGVDLDSLTNLHTLEDAVPDFKFPVYHKTVFNTLVIDADGTKRNMETKVHDPVWSKKRQCNALTQHFETAGFLMKFKIGMTDCIIIKADKLHHWMVKNYYDRGITMYTPDDQLK